MKASDGIHVISFSIANVGKMAFENVWGTCV